MQKSNYQSISNVFQFFLFSLVAINIGCQKGLQEKINTQLTPNGISSNNNKIPQSLKDFTQVNLVANNDQYNAARVDPLLINAWGLTFNPNGTPWISAEGTGYSTVYNREGIQVLPAVSIPSDVNTADGHPTGVVFNGTTDFKLPNGSPARFIFDGTDGVLSGWNPGNLGMAIKMVDKSATSVYTGLALAKDGNNNFLYAANFKAGKIDVFDKDWQEVNKSFIDPNMPSGYAPFNIQAIGTQLYIMYAKVGADGDEEKHPGFGYVNIYNTDGSFVKRFISKGQLNAPWGIAMAPAGFYGNNFSVSQNTILVGNFGDGHINAFGMDGEFLGQLRSHGNPIEIKGLWAIDFPPSTSTIDPNRLYFTAGPNNEKDGLFGYLVK